MIILFGLAGSGKGTQGKALSEIFGWRTISVGEAIRRTGEYEELTKRGELVPDLEVIKIMDKQISKTEAEGFDIILDGYPRDITQAEYIIKTMPEKIDGAIVLEVPKEELLNRLALRGRNDDKDINSINNRFAVFEKNIGQILPLLESKNIPIARVDGTGSVTDVTARLIKIVKQFNPSATEQQNDVNGEEIEKSYGE